PLAWNVVAIAACSSTSSKNAATEATPLLNERVGAGKIQADGMRAPPASGLSRISRCMINECFQVMACFEKQHRRHRVTIVKVAIMHLEMRDNSSCHGCNHRYVGPHNRTVWAPVKMPPDAWSVGKGWFWRGPVLSRWVQLAGVGWVQCQDGAEGS